MNDAEELEEVTEEAQEEITEEVPKKEKGELGRFLLANLKVLEIKQNKIEEVIKSNQKFIKVHHEQLKRLNDNFTIFLEQRK